MDIKELKLKLRSDYANKIIPLVKKDKCELCSSKENLIVHHEYAFMSQLYNISEKLHIDVNNDITNKEFELLRTMMLGSQLQHKNTTLCSECHIKVHNKEGGFVAIERENILKRKAEIRKSEKIKANNINKKRIDNKLEEIFKNNTIMLNAKDRTPVIELIGLIDKHNSKLKDSKDGTKLTDIKYVKNINSLNGYLEEINSKYRIKQYSTHKNGKRYANAWKLVK